MSSPSISMNQWGVLECEPGYANPVTVNVGVNQPVTIDKLYGPLCAFNVRVRLEMKDDPPTTDWVVERERPLNGSQEMEWVEMARWDCQLDWWNKEDDEYD